MIGGNDRCLCGVCGEIFISIHAFKKHILDFKCLSIAEMEAKGMFLNADGYWCASITPEYGPRAATGCTRATIWVKSPSC